MSNRLNILHGVSTIMVLDVSSENTYANAVLPAGIIVRKTDNIFYLTDGTHTIRQLSPIVDQVITATEKNAIAKAFSNDSYVRAANGMVVHNNLGKIDDSSLNIVDGGKLKVSYLSDFVENNLIKYAKLPDEVKLSFYVVNTYNDLASLSTEQRKKLIVVKDASGDPTNDITGSGLYYYNNAWISVLSVATSTLEYDDVNNLGAVMYDHMIHVTTTSSDIRNVLDKLVIGEVQPSEPSEPDDPTPPDPPTPIDPDEPNPDEPDPDEPVVVDTVHNETREYMELGWEDFVSGINSMVNGLTSDIYLEDHRDNHSKNYAMLIITDNSELDFTNATLTINCDGLGVNMTLPVTATVEGNDKIGVIEYNRDSGEVAEGLAALRNYGNDDVAENNSVDLTVTDGVHTYTGRTIRSVFGYSGGLPSFNIPGFYSPF